MINNINDNDDIDKERLKSYELPLYDRKTKEKKKKYKHEDPAPKILASDGLTTRELARPGKQVPQPPAPNYSSSELQEQSN